MKKLNDPERSMKVMRAGLAFAVLAIVLVVGGVGAGALLLIPCILMIGVVMRGAGGSSPGGRGAK
jgi:hypothetical protein